MWVVSSPSDRYWRDVRFRVHSGRTNRPCSSLRSWTRQTCPAEPTKFRIDANKGNRSCGNPEYQARRDRNKKVTARPDFSVTAPGKDSLAYTRASTEPSTPVGTSWTVSTRRSGRAPGARPHHRPAPGQRQMLRLPLRPGAHGLVSRRRDVDVRGRSGLRGIRSRRKRLCRLPP